MDLWLSKCTRHRRTAAEVEVSFSTYDVRVTEYESGEFGLWGVVGADGSWHLKTRGMGSRLRGVRRDLELLGLSSSAGQEGAGGADTQRTSSGSTRSRSLTTGWRISRTGSRSRW